MFYPTIFLPTLHHIVEQAKQLKDAHTSEKNAPVNYACIFCQNEQEYEQFYTAASEMGKVIKETPSGELFHITPVDTVAGKLQLVKIRKPDPTRPERGDADFTVADYDTFKKAYMSKEGFKLIENRPDIIEMIELMDPSFDVRAYFSKVPLDVFYKLT